MVWRPSRNGHQVSGARRPATPRENGAGLLTHTAGSLRDRAGCGALHLPRGHAGSAVGRCARFRSGLLRRSGTTARRSPTLHLSPPASFRSTGFRWAALRAGQADAAGAAALGLPVKRGRAALAAGTARVPGKPASPAPPLRCGPVGCRARSWRSLALAGRRPPPLSGGRVWQ